MINEKIDLTEHRDFGSTRNAIINNLRSDSIELWEAIMLDLNQKRYGKFIWRIEDSKSPPPFDGLFPLGNKEQRKEILKMHNWGRGTGKTCDCCGKPIINIPWKHFSGLCKECSESFREVKTLTDENGNKEYNFPWL